MINTIGLNSGITKKNTEFELDKLNKEYVYIPKGSLDKWKAALNEVKGYTTDKKAKICVVHTSIGEGAGAGLSDWETNSYTSIIRNKFKEEFDDVGAGIINTEFNNGTKLWTFANATWTRDLPYGSMGQCRYTSTIGGTAEIDFTGTAVRVYYIGSTNSRVFSWRIDGGAKTNVDCIGDAFQIKTLDITGLADSSHTLTLTIENATAVRFLGAEEIKGSNGVIVHMNGINGGDTNQAVFNQFNIDAEINFQKPDLTIIELVANDFFTPQTSLATYRSNLQQLIDAGLSHGSVLITSVGLADADEEIPQSEYVKVVRDLAIKNNIAYYDNYNDWNADFDYADGLGLISDTVHPSVPGHQWIANKIYDIIK